MVLQVLQVALVLVLPVSTGPACLAGAAASGLTSSIAGPTSSTGPASPAGSAGGMWGSVVLVGRGCS